MMQLPIPRPTPSTEEKIERMLKEKDYEKIDSLVCELYGLTEEEARIN